MTDLSKKFPHSFKVIIANRVLKTTIKSWQTCMTPFLVFFFLFLTSQTIAIQIQLKIVCTLHKDYEFQCSFCPFCPPIIFGSASDQENITYHIQIRLPYKSLERILSKRAETIKHFGVWCHFNLYRLRRQWCKQRGTTQGNCLFAT